MTDPLDYAALAAAAEVDWRSEYLRLFTAHRALIEAHKGLLAAIPKTGFKPPEEIEVERQAAAAKNRRLRARRKAKRQCLDCKKHAAKGKTRCRACLADNRERSRKRRKTARHRSNRRDYDLAKRARGECVACNRPALPGRTRCEEHARRTNAAARNRYRKTRKLRANESVRDPQSNREEKAMDAAIAQRKATVRQSAGLS